MADIEELQRRLAVAIERIAKGVEGLDVPPPEADDAAQIDVEALQAKLSETESALEDERMVGQQREERIKSLHAKLEDVEATMKSRLDAQSEATAQVDLELQRLRRANAQLLESNKSLREAQEEGLSDPHLVNTAMIAELEALSAARSSEIAEAAAIEAALKQLLPGENREDA